MGDLSNLGNGMSERLHTVVAGLSWKTAPAELRDQCLLPPERADQLLGSLRSHGVSECMVLSTCNRVEIWAASEEVDQAASTCLDLWEGLCHPSAGWRDRLYVRRHVEAVDHVLRVTSSVDSLVPGETQIAGQVKRAWESAFADGHAASFLSRLSQTALSASKRVRSGTRLGEGAISISSAAVDLARKIAGDLAGLSIGIVGAGEMAELALAGFVRAGARSFVYANRTVSNTGRLQALHPGRSSDLSDLGSILAESDVVVTATGSPGFLVTPELVAAAMRERDRPLFLLDIAAPRDVDPEVAKIPGVFLHGIDDLEQVVGHNRRQREEESKLAEPILVQERERFRAWWCNLSMIPVLSRVREDVHALAHAEVERFVPRLNRARGESEVREALDDFAQALANKFLHPPTAGARLAAAQGREAEIIAVLHELFPPAGAA